MFAISASTASGSKFKPNKHNVLPLVLSPIQGSLPTNAGVLDGTLAQRLGIQAGFRYVVNIVFEKMNVVMTKEGEKSYPQYQYSVVACLGQDFDKMVAEKLVASMQFDFNFGVGRTSTSVATPITAPEETPEPVEEVA